MKQKSWDFCVLKYSAHAENRTQVHTWTETKLCPLFATHTRDECKLTQNFLNLQHRSFESESKAKPAHIWLARVSFHSDAESKTMQLSSSSLNSSYQHNLGGKEKSLLMIIESDVVNLQLRQRRLWRVRLLLFPFFPFCSTQQRVAWRKSAATFLMNAALSVRNMACCAYVCQHRNAFPGQGRKLACFGSPVCFLLMEQSPLRRLQLWFSAVQIKVDSLKFSSLAEFLFAQTL